MIQVRENCFETNSSSVHTICMCTESIYSKWAKNLESITSDSYLYTYDSLVPILDVIKDYNEYEEKYNDGKNKVTIDDILNKESPLRDTFISFITEEYYTKDSFFRGYDETYCEDYTTPNGETVVAFGRYGWDS